MPTDLGMTLRYRASEAGAQAMGISVQPFGVREPNDFDQAFAAMNREMPEAILMVADSLTISTESEYSSSRRRIGCRPSTSLTSSSATAA